MGVQNFHGFPTTPFIKRNFNSLTFVQFMRRNQLDYTLEKAHVGLFFTGYVRTFGGDCGFFHDRPRFAMRRFRGDMRSIGIRKIDSIGRFDRGALICVKLRALSCELQATLLRCRRVAEMDQRARPRSR